MTTCLGSRGSVRLDEATSDATVDILLLGSGWTSTFLMPLLDERKLTYAYTTKDGRDGSIKFSFESSKTEALSAEQTGDLEQFERLPAAQTIVIIFPLYGPGASTRLVKNYLATHPTARPLFVQLGSTGIYDGGPTMQHNASTVGSDDGAAWRAQDPIRYIDRHSTYNTTNPRAVAEDELLSLSPTLQSQEKDDEKSRSVKASTTVLNLSGLWGGPRSIRAYVGRIAPTKEALSAKGSIHMLHGLDLARAIVAVSLPDARATTQGQRWIVSDTRCYDWWELASAWGLNGDDRSAFPKNASKALQRTEKAAATGHQAEWVVELMAEQKVFVLPRGPERLHRIMSSLEFWSAFGLAPIKARLE
ncbi:uncharacterized protein L969DRAFT_95719 [Mixia osmundae IAM 14324]|uniref:Uncharacterized protein n=1 Tax=Mixia osmundae (strain CBS 9802 / IAM 14324 / JCM 22182 / KY 12970) TaxID=764103 RepID=G7E0M9_MIXOS|nr:uncharacterized protein L969DRAFT_95719 [Mixia osmundae IAM 14324]KEI37865.1 hypothetical protein L969DRAFT_95719 [Mixia osmundae IAM 14324]GAA96389.1 hypothetical protein E5Q_03056 [Mixia osmundae IAM 14324]